MGCLKRTARFLLLVAILMELGLLLWVRERSPSGLLGWEETSNRDRWYSEAAPNPPYSIGPGDRETLEGFVASAGILDGITSDFEVTVALRNLVRTTCPAIEKSPETNDPVEILEGYLNGRGGACGSLASVYCAVLITQGYRARVVQLVRDEMYLNDWVDGPPDTHVTVEVFSNEHGKWYVNDPTFNCVFYPENSHVPLSAAEIQSRIASGLPDIGETGFTRYELAGVIVPDYAGTDTLQRVDTYYIDPVLVFENVFLLYYDIYADRPEGGFQKYVSLLTARFTGTEKIVRILGPGQAPGHIFYFNVLANWIPVVIVGLLILLMIPSGRPAQDYEDEEEDEGEVDEEE